MKQHKPKLDQWDAENILLALFLIILILSADALSEFIASYILSF